MIGIHSQMFSALARPAPGGGAGGVPVTWGFDELGVMDSNTSTERRYLIRLTAATATGTVNKMYAYTFSGNSQRVLAGVIMNSTGSVVLGYSDTTLISDNEAWIELNFPTGVPVTSGVSYRMAVVGDGIVGVPKLGWSTTPTVVNGAAQDTTTADRPNGDGSWPPSGSTVPLDMSDTPLIYAVIDT